LSSYWIRPPSIWHEPYRSIIGDKSKEVLDTFLRIHETLQEQVGNVIDQLQQDYGDAGKAMAIWRATLAN